MKRGRTERGQGRAEGGRNRRKDVKKDGKGMEARGERVFIRVRHSKGNYGVGTREQR